MAGRASSAGGGLTARWRRLGRALCFVLFAAQGCRRELPGSVDAGAGGPAELGAEAGAERSGAGAQADAGGAEALDGAVEAGPEVESMPPERRRRCPPDMVDVAGRFCIDRYEDTLIDDSSGRGLSPHYPPEPAIARRMFEKWRRPPLEGETEKARAMSIPLLPDFEVATDFLPKAVSHKGALPQGYVSGKMAAVACQRAGKRLCALEEWRHACRGEKQTKYPYGGEYIAGACNVFRSEHPAAILHGNASIGHSDPRLGLVRAQDGPLLRKTGASPSCVSRWGRDRIYDMVGNVDEWIDDPNGTFVGGFFSRSTREGCDSMVTAHAFDYWDYSLGVRCCLSLSPDAR